jgi:hypothetical protein
MFTSDRNSGAQRSFEFEYNRRLKPRAWLLQECRIVHCGAIPEQQRPTSNASENAEKGFISTTPRAATALSYSLSWSADGGLGVGLWLAKSLIQMHDDYRQYLVTEGGIVIVDSERCPERSLLAIA